MSTRGKLLSTIYFVFSTPLILLGFAGLLSRKMGFQIPFVSTEIIPALDRYAVWGETLRGRTVLLGGEDWFFLILLGMMMMLAIFMVVVNFLIRAAQEPESRGHETGTRKGR